MPWDGQYFWLEVPIDTTLVWPQLVAPINAATTFFLHVERLYPYLEVIYYAFYAWYLSLIIELPPYPISFVGVQGQGPHKYDPYGGLHKRKWGPLAHLS